MGEGGSAVRVVKRNKRLWIDDDAGNPVYTPPDFIHLQSREPIIRLAERLRAVSYIDAVMDFEANATTKRKGRFR